MIVVAFVLEQPLEAVHLKAALRRHIESADLLPDAWLPVPDGLVELERLALAAADRLYAADALEAPDPAEVAAALAATLEPDVDREQLLTTRQVADWLQVSDRTVQRLVRTGDLPCTSVGRSRRFDPADVRDYIDRER